MSVASCGIYHLLQSISVSSGSELADWDGDVCAFFPVADEPDIPSRWRNASAGSFCVRLLDVRQKPLSGAHRFESCSSEGYLAKAISGGQLNIGRVGLALRFR